MKRLSFILMFIFVILFSVNIDAVSRTPGQVQFSSYDNTYYVYLKQGEKINFKAITKNNGNKNVDITLRPPSTSSLSAITQSANSSTGTNATLDFTPTSIVSDVDGVFSITAINQTGAGSGSTYFTFLYEIHTYDENDIEVLGKTWTENYKLYQIGISSANNLDNLQLWHKTIGGYLYLTDFRDYNGVLSEIVSDPIGITKTVNSDCLPAYFSYRYRLDTGYNPQYNILQNVSACSNTVNSNKIFIDSPDPNLPQQVVLPNGTTTWLNRSIQNLSGTLSTAPLSNDSYKSEIKYSVNNFEGVVEIQIDTNNNGTYSDTEDVIIQKVYKYGDSNESVVWDGKDGNGNPVPIDKQVNVRLFARGAGEIHFVSTDVERSIGGIEVTRLNGVTSNNKVLYWDDRPLEITGCTTPIINGTTGIDSTGGVHNWDNDTLCNYDKPHDLKTSDNTSWGDGNYIHNWTYEKIDKEIREVSIQPRLAKLVFTNKVTDESGDGVLNLCEKFEYTLEVSNVGENKAEDVEIKDIPTDILPYIYNGNNPEKIVVKVNNNGNLSEISLQDLMNGYYVDIPMGKKVTITFELQILCEMPIEEPNIPIDLENKATAGNNKLGYQKANSKIKLKKIKLKIPNGGTSIDLIYLLLSVSFILGVSRYAFKEK